ncbi:transposase [Plantactinospora sp. CA-290183]|uniref:transposase n=1 Tax=Plantactinospora sp. CA-290183 TaxID=3240006 RepID=UPI003D8F4F5A
MLSERHVVRRGCPPGSSARPVAHNRVSQGSAPPGASGNRRRAPASKGRGPGKPEAFRQIVHVYQRLLHPQRREAFGVRHPGGVVGADPGQRGTHHGDQQRAARLQSDRGRTRWGRSSSAWTRTSVPPPSRSSTFGKRRSGRAGSAPTATATTKPQLARRLIETAVAGGLLCRWVTGDEAYGGDPALATALRQHRFGYVLAVACSHRTPTGLGVQRADRIAACLPAHAWQRISSGDGAKGYRYYDWAFITLPLATDQHAGHHWLLVRRNRANGELAFYRCWSPETVALHHLVTVAGRRWSIEESFQAAKLDSASTSISTAAGKPGTAGRLRSSPRTPSSPPRPPSAPPARTA